MIRTLIQHVANREAPPVSTIFVVGAGSGSDLLALRQLDAVRLVLAEAHPGLAGTVGRRVDARRNEEVWPIAITPSDEHNILHVLSQWRYNSLKSPSGLAQYLPNVCAVESITVASQPIEESITNLALDPSATNILVLDVPGQASCLVQGAAACSLQLFSWIIARCSSVPLYDGEGPTEKLAGYLAEIGFDVAAESLEAVFPESALLFSRNDSLIEKRQLKATLERLRSEQVTMIALVESMQAELERAIEEVKCKTEEVTALGAELGRATETANCRAEEVSVLGVQLEKLRQERDAKALQLEIKIVELSKSNAMNAQQRKHLKDLRMQSLSWMKKVENEAVDLAIEFRKDLNDATKGMYRRMDRATINAAKQVEAFIGVQNYLATGELPSLSTESHAWPVSPDFAQYLIELMELNDYGVVIEFGSGFSTVIMAKAIARKSENCRGRSLVALTSFDHLEKYYAQTKKHLTHSRVFESVNLVLAPLEPYEAPNESTYLYYDCLEAIHDLGKQYDAAGVRLLVVVDGPPGRTGKHARYPALPIVLSFFKEAQVDFLLDDYAREDELEIVDAWQADLAKDGINFDVSVRKLEKDACLLRVRPGAPEI